ncbi:DUF421 domain-containing protein [Paenibacillus allorhizosphaerae]|uniref:YetF C-terminal domain-containing protein n=1 Tax=Paenibacillus allorhizosphaerae TaxID=2849866 RepID=A0ABM8VCW5_9BACL|nr:YetF domain-containing protein [Paenibacillus allorhizosphaerae]CAG7625326.1 hypothetical protein PAECIP111802_01157 [Paenibacillus allorhizosphaerae]
MSYIWEALVILLIGFGLMRIAGKKTVSEMNGPEIITLLAIASVIGDAVSMKGFWATTVTLCIFVGLLILLQYMSVKWQPIERLFMGKATPIIENGQLMTKNLLKLRMSVDQVENRLRENGITSFSDVKHATIEMNGQLGYELMNHAKPVTVGELEKLLARLHIPPPPQAPTKQPNLFDEVMYGNHEEPIPGQLK